MRANYFPIGCSINVVFDLMDLSTRDRINIFNELLDSLGIRDILLREDSATIGKIEAQLSSLWDRKEDA